MLSNFFLSLKFINLFTWNYRGTETVYNLNLSNQKVKENIWSSGLSEMVNRKPRRVIPKRKGTTKGFLWLPLFRLEVSRLKFWERNSNRDWVLCWARKIVYSSVNQSKIQERKTLENVKEIRRGISSSGHSHKETIPGSRATETCAEQTNSLLSLCWLVLCQRNTDYSHLRGRRESAPRRPGCRHFLNYWSKWEGPVHCVWGHPTPGLMVLGSMRKEAEQTMKSKSEAGLLYGCCNSSRLHVPSNFEFLPWRP